MAYMADMARLVLCVSSLFYHSIQVDLRRTATAMVKTGQSLSKCNAEYKSDTKGSTKGHQAKNVQIYRRICNIYISNIYIYICMIKYIYIYV